MAVQVSTEAARRFLGLQGRLLEPGDQASIDDATQRLLELFGKARFIGAVPRESGLSIYRPNHVREINSRHPLELIVRNAESQFPVIEKVRLKHG